MEEIEDIMLDIELVKLSIKLEEDTDKREILEEELASLYILRDKL